jgi:hypothetical protein
MRGPTGWLRRSGSARSAGFVLALVVVAAGCTSEPDQPATLPEDTPTATSATASPRPMTPEQEVEAAVRAYYDELTRAAQTQETARLKGMMTRGCPCYGYVESIERTRRRGESAPAAAWSLRSVRIHHLEGATAAAEVEYRVEPYALLDGDGDEIRRFPARTGHVDLSLVNSSGNWVIGNVFNLEG